MVRHSGGAGKRSEQATEVRVAIEELVDLRYRLQMAKERLTRVAKIPEREQQFGGQELERCGHKFRNLDLSNGPVTCDICEKPIFAKMMTNPLKRPKPRGYSCSICKFSVHRKVSGNYLRAAAAGVD